MKRDEALALLQAATPDDDYPVVLPKSVLRGLSVSDIPPHIQVEVGSTRGRAIHPDFWGHFYANSDGFIAFAEFSYVRKFWLEPLNLDHYLDLVQRAAEVRATVRDDISDVDRQINDDNGYFLLTFTIYTGKKNFRAALDYAQAVVREIEEAAQSASSEVGKLAAALASRISAWGKSRHVFPRKRD